LPGCGIGLAEAYASQAYGELRSLSRVEGARWRDRMSYRAGLRQLAPFPFDLPDDLPADERQAVESMWLLLVLRGWEINEPFPFARRTNTGNERGFGVAWSELTDWRLRAATAGLERRQVIYRCSTVATTTAGRPPITWALSCQAARVVCPVCGRERSAQRGGFCSTCRDELHAELDMYRAELQEVTA
jgi:hypothetical protein